jgi:Ca-activated chloride channel family protein
VGREILCITPNQIQARSSFNWNLPANISSTARIQEVFAMRVSRVHSLVLTALLLASALPAFSQGKPVTLVFSATDKKGLSAGDLKVADVRVSEGGKDQTISSVRKLGDSPLSLVFLIDGSIGTAAVPTYWQGEAVSFLMSTLHPKTDKAEVLHYRGNVTTTQDMTGDIAALSVALKTNAPTGAALVYDALATVSDSLAKVEGRRVIVLVSDGQDQGSRMKLDAVAEKVRESGAVVYPITVKSDRVTAIDDTPEFFLRRLAEESGGLTFNVTKAQDAQNAFKEIQAALSAQFSVQYQPTTGADGRFHKVKVELADKKLKVRQPMGYYANQ